MEDGELDRIVDALQIISTCLSLLPITEDERKLTMDCILESTNEAIQEHGCDNYFFEAISETVH